MQEKKNKSGGDRTQADPHDTARSIHQQAAELQRTQVTPGFIMDYARVQRELAETRAQRDEAMGILKWVAKYPDVVGYGFWIDKVKDFVARAEAGQGKGAQSSS